MAVFGPTPDILEVTLRDGSYLVDFQFTAEDTIIVAGALGAAGFRWIELGHGLGLNATASGKGEAAATDEEYLEAAAETLKVARWGMFFIPGIGRAEDLRLAARYKMSFVRIGTNIAEIDQAQPFITLAKELGLIVSYNAMKSYAASPSEFGKYAAKSRKWGADIIYLVDSAGGMYPEDISAYLTAAQGESDIALGFHGHDNLSLAMANTLRALDCGAVLVDSSLQGMGRSAGNAVTESLVAILTRRGVLPHIDLKKVMDIGQGLIRPLIRRCGVDSLAITAGYARFHSSLFDNVKRYAEKYRVDVRDLIVRLCQEDQTAAPDELLEHLSQDLAKEKLQGIVTIPATALRHPRISKGSTELPSLIKELRSRAIKAGKYSTLNVVIGQGPQPDTRVSGNIQSTQAHMVGSVSVTNEEQLRSVLTAVDGKLDLIYLDVDKKLFCSPSSARTAEQYLKKTLLLTYRDSQVWIEAVENQATRLLGENLEETTIVIMGDDPKISVLAHHLADRNAQVTLITTAAPGSTSAPFYPAICSTDRPAVQAALARAKMVVAWSVAGPVFGFDDAREVSTGTFVIDASIGAISPEALEIARHRGLYPIRVNIWPTLAGALLAAHESARSCKESLGWGKIAGLPVVSGGALGQRGDIIVDSIYQPTRVIGVADGHGGIQFTYGPEDDERVRKVIQEINRRFIMPHVADEG